MYPHGGWAKGEQESAVHHLGRGRQVKDEEREAQRWGEAFRPFQQGQRRKKPQR